MKLNNDTSFTDNLSPFYRLLTYDQKFEKDGKWFDECIEYADNLLGFTDLKYMTKIDVNYAIAKGKNGLKVYNDLLKRRSLNMKDSVDYDALNRKNYDILSPIFKSIVGEQQKRQLNVIAKDASPYNINMFKKKKLELYQDWVKTNIQNPIMEQINMEIMMKYQIANPQDLNPEEQDQIKSEIEALRKFKSPKDIDKFMRDDYISPTETQLQEIANWAISEFNLKFITDESFKHLFLAGREISYTSIENYKPLAKILNPKGFRYLGKDNSYFIGEGELWSYEEFVTYSEFIRDIPMDSNIMPKLKEIVTSHGLSNLASTRSFFEGEAPGVMSEVLAAYNIQTSGGLAEAVPKDIGSREGQNFLGNLYSMFGNSSIHLDRVRKVNTCYTSLDKLFLVERIDEKTDKLKFYWVGENYESNRELDHRVTEYWCPAYYQANSLGYMKDFVYNKKRVEFQNRSMIDPFNIVSPYDGVEYSRLFNNAEITAPLDFGKVLQDEYNLVKEKIEELDKTNIGKIFLLPETLLPDNQTTEQWMSNLKENKVGIINAEASSLNPAIAAQILRSVDLTNNNDIAGYQNRLQAIKYEAEQVMCYSPSALGQAPASITATTNQQNIIQTSYKTEDIFTLHDMFIARFVNNIVLTIKNAMLSNENLKESLLSIPSIAALNIDFDLLAESVPTIFFLNRTNEVQQIKDIKNLLQPMIQNQTINSLSEIMKIQFYDNPASLLNLAEDSERKAEERAEAAMRNENENAEKERQLRMEMKQKEIDLEKYRIDVDAETKREVSNKDYRKFQLQADSDENKVPDSVQVAKVKHDTEISKKNMEMDMERLKLEIEKDKIKNEK